MASSNVLLGSVTKQRLGLSPNVIVLSTIIILIHPWNKKLNEGKWNLFASASSEGPEKKSHPGHMPLRNGKLWPPFPPMGGENLTPVIYISQLWPGRYFLLLSGSSSANQSLTSSKISCFLHLHTQRPHMSQKHCLAVSTDSAYLWSFCFFCPIAADQYISIIKI